MASAHIILALQSIVSRNVDPREMAVITVAAIHAGNAPNVIPDAVDWLGAEGVIADLQPLTGSEDFSFMLEQCPGCYLIIGNGVGDTHGSGGCMVHNPGYDFNDACLPIAASYWVKLVEKFLSA